MIICCPSCGRPLDNTHLIGRSLKCPACKSQYLYQNGIVIDPVNRFFPSTIPWKDLIEKIFSNVIENNDYVLGYKIKVLERKEYYEPFIEVIDKEKKYSLVDVGMNRPLSVQPILDVRKFKQHESTSQGNPEMHVTLQDEAYVDALTSALPYVESSIMYVAMRELSFTIDGNTYKCVSYADELVFEEGNLDAVSKKRLDFTLLLRIINILLFLFSLLVINGAWKLFCGSYVHFHGIDLIIMASGYKCFLPFLGTSILVAIGAKFISSMIEGIVQSKDYENLTFVQYRIKQFIIKKFNL